MILGGVSGGDEAGKPVAEVEVYDPETQQFSVQGRLRKPRQDHSAILLDDGRILVVGGMDWSGGEPGPVSAIEAYDPAGQRSTKVGRLRQPRWDHDAFLLPDGRILIIGMVVRGDPRWMDTRVFVELFDPGSGESQRLSRQGLDLMGRTGVRLADDRILLVGGHRPGVIFDPASERFKETGRPTTSRSGESLTLRLARSVSPPPSIPTPMPLNRTGAEARGPRSWCHPCASGNGQTPAPRWWARGRTRVPMTPDCHTMWSTP